MSGSSKGRTSGLNLSLCSAGRSKFEICVLDTANLKFAPGAGLRGSGLAPLKNRERGVMSDGRPGLYDTVEIEKVPRSLLIKRLRDYESMDQKDLIQQLVEKWRELHPEAAKEESGKFYPLELSHAFDRKENPHDPDEDWMNNLYTVALRRQPDRVFGTQAGMIQLGIASIDGTARHDWRHFQMIKNQLAGPECEAFELYPAESRLLDPSNYYTLWCFPGIKRIKVGSDDPRRVWDADVAMAPQRALAK
jgi:hypothetical protein